MWIWLNTNLIQLVKEVIQFLLAELDVLLMSSDNFCFYAAAAIGSSITLICRKSEQK